MAVSVDALSDTERGCAERHGKMSNRREFPPSSRIPGAVCNPRNQMLCI